MPEIQRKTARGNLQSRREPYWQQIGDRGEYLGFRKTKVAPGTWVARYRDVAGKQHYRSIGTENAHAFADAAKLANTWFDQCRHGVVKRATVSEACRAYIANLQALKGGARAGDHAKRFETLVYETALGEKPLDQLRAVDIEQWRDSLLESGRRGRATANRHLRALKAALNYGHRQQMVGSNSAWLAVAPFPAPDKQREHYLDFEQRKALLAACRADLGNFVRGLLLTGARPNELAAATVGNFDPRMATLELVSNKGKDGKPRPRSIPLATQAFEFFRYMARDKLPAAPLVSRADGRAFQKIQWTRELKRAVIAAGLPRDVVCYTCRHTVISDWLAAGVDVASVAELAGTSILMIDKHYHKFIKARVRAQLADVPAF